MSFITVPVRGKGLPEHIKMVLRECVDPDGNPVNVSSCQYIGQGMATFEGEVYFADFIIWHRYQRIQGWLVHVGQEILALLPDEIDLGFMLRQGRESNNIFVCE
jgi:hypothetical protein